VPVETPNVKPSTKRASSNKKATSNQVPKQVPVKDKPTEPESKKAKKVMPTKPKIAHLLQKSVVRGKIVKLDYFQE